MTATLDMNTPDLNADNTADEGNQTSSMDMLEAQLLRHQFQRVQPRNYRRILRESNLPAPWYSKKSSPPCSIYFYDPQYQKYLQERSAVQNPSKINSSRTSIRLPQSPSYPTSNYRSSPRKSNVIDTNVSYSYFSPTRSRNTNDHPTPSRRQPVPTLPAIDPRKK